VALLAVGGDTAHCVGVSPQSVIFNHLEEPF
jgi:hypothetical protein